jgi:stearoyl-CoA 9-desaturase NADPH oxidoreductase
MRRLAGAVADLATPHGIDSYLRLVRPTWSLGRALAEMTDVHRDALGSTTLELRPNARWGGFRAGQYVMVTVEIDGVRHTRCYSPANAEQDGRRLELTVKAHPHGVVSQFLHEHARPGMVVELSEALGTFTLPAHRPDHLLLISGGSGITPVISMLRTLCAQGHEGRVGFLHYSLRADAMPYRDEVAALAAAHPNLTVARAFTDEPGKGELDGLLSVEHLAAVDPAWADAETYVCGPGPLMAAVEEHVAAAGRNGRVHTEAFTLDTIGAEASLPSGGILRFGASGSQVEDDGRSILEQAEGAGLRPSHGCRMGICHTCPRMLHRGTVRNLQDGTTTGAGEPVRICVSAPAGDIEIDL